MGTPTTKRKAATRKATKKSTKKSTTARARKAPARKTPTKKGPTKKAAARGKAGAGKKGKNAVAKKPTPDLEVDPDVLEFINAIDAYKTAYARPFPSWSEILHIIKELGYRRR